MGEGKAIQHYIPQFILRNFHGDKLSQIFVFDKSNGSTYTANISKVAAEFKFYDMEVNGKTFSLESALSEFEAKTSVIINKAIATKNIKWISA